MADENKALVLTDQGVGQVAGQLADRLAIRMVDKDLGVSEHSLGVNVLSEIGCNALEAEHLRTEATKMTYAVPAQHATYRHLISASIVLAGLVALIWKPAVGGWIVLVVAIMNAPSIVEQVKKALNR